MSENVETVPVYNQHEGLLRRDGGPYLDEQERRDAETRRAQVEDREPDYDNASATAGVPLVRAEILVQSNNVNSAPSVSRQGPDALVTAVNKLKDDKDVFPNPAGEATFTPAGTGTVIGATQVSTEDGPRGVPDEDLSSEDTSTEPVVDVSENNDPNRQDESVF